MNLDNPRKVITGFVSVLAGVWVYCLLLAPLLSDQPYGDVVADKASSIGLGWTVAVVIVGAIFTAYAMRKSASK